MQNLESGRAPEHGAQCCVRRTIRFWHDACKQDERRRRQTRIAPRRSAHPRPRHRHRRRQHATAPRGGRHRGAHTRRREHGDRLSPVSPRQQPSASDPSSVWRGAFSRRVLSLSTACWRDGGAFTASVFSPSHWVQGRLCYFFSFYKTGMRWGGSFIKISPLWRCIIISILPQLEQRRKGYVVCWCFPVDFIPSKSQTCSLFDGYFSLTLLLLLSSAEQVISLHLWKKVSLTCHHQRTLPEDGVEM